MWDRAGKLAREARQARDFAHLHALAFHPTEAPDLPASAGAHPFENQQRRHCVSGEWRGRAVQRFSTSEITVELMALPGVLPRLHVIPSGLEGGALAIGSRVVATGDPVFDSRWTVRTDDEQFAIAFLSPRIREALLHPAAAGRALVVDGGAAYLWAPGEQAWSEARVRFEFLSVIVGRVDAGLFAAYGPMPRALPTPDAGIWVPAEQPVEVDRWVVAAVPEQPARDAAGDALGDTGEFEVALLNAELSGTTFLPGPDDPASEYGTWLVAPEMRA